MAPPKAISKNSKDEKGRQPEKDKIRSDVNLLCRSLDLSKTTVRDVIKMLQEKYGGIKLEKTSQKFVKGLLVEYMLGKPKIHDKTTKKKGNIVTAGMSVGTNNELSYKNKSNDETQWMHFYDEAKTFIIKHGHFNIPDSRKALQKWMKTQRKSYVQFHEKSSPEEGINESDEFHLTKDQVVLLNELGFEWNQHVHPSKQALLWIKQYEQLEKFFAEHKTTHIQYEMNRSLAIWTRTQRKKHHEKSLTKHQIKMMNDLKFDWDLAKSERPGSEWVEMYENSIKEKIGKTPNFSDLGA